MADLKKVLKMNSISNCPVTEEDVQLAEKVFGPDVGSCWTNYVNFATK